MKHVLLHKAVDTYVSETSEVQEGVEVEVHVCTSECVARVCVCAHMELLGKPLQEAGMNLQD